MEAPRRLGGAPWAELALKAREQAPADPEACATLGSVQAAWAELAEAIRTLEGATGLAGEPLLQLEDYRRSYLPSLASYASADWAIYGTRREVLIPEGALWRYTVATAGEPAPGWAELGFRDDAWSEGPSGFGCGGGDDATVLEPRRDEAVHVRHVFTVARPQRCQVLVLSLQVDGAYEVWLNGREVARGTADAGGRMRRKPHVFVETAIETSVLREGENVLAIRARDAALWGRGLSLVPVLRQRSSRTVRRSWRSASASPPWRVARRSDGFLPTWTPASSSAMDGRRRRRRATPSYRPRSAPRPSPTCGTSSVSSRGARPRPRRHTSKKSSQAASTGPRSGTSGRESPSATSAGAQRSSSTCSLRSTPRAPGTSSGCSSGSSADGAIRVNCGGEQYASASGLGWGADSFSSSGGKEQSDNDFVRVAGTDDQPLYKVARSFPPLPDELPGYRLPLPRGRYRVTLHFAEVNFDFQGPGRRVFDVLVEGKPMLEGYDAVARVGFGTAEAVRSEPIVVEDGRLEIEFVHRVRNPLVSAIEIKRVD
jgi:hypothetical protein